MNLPFRPFALLLFPVVFAFSTTLVVEPAAAQAVSLPPGSYQQSCRDVLWVPSAKQLRATCSRSNGVWEANPMLYTGECVGDIFNLEGTLGCSSGQTPPAGPYTTMCPDRWMQGTRLHARCGIPGAKQGPPSVFAHSELEAGACRGPISSFGGRLTCDQGVPIPTGSYQQSCTVRMLVDDHLDLLCRKADGRQQAATSVVGVSWCNGDITNNDGVASCPRAPIPRGTYELTCQDMVRRGDALGARCKNAAGALVAATLPSMTACAGKDIKYDAGVLKCGDTYVPPPPPPGGGAAPPPPAAATPPAQLQKLPGARVLTR